MSKKQKTQPSQPGHDVFVVLLGEAIGIAIMAIVADINDNIGKIAVALMAAWLLIFLMTNGEWISEMASKL